MHESHPYRKAGILLFSVFASIAIYAGIARSIPSGSLQYTQIEEWYGFASIIFLFLAMLAGPLYRVFPHLPYKKHYFGSLGGLGISAFYFALLHASVSFFYLLYGFPGLPFLQPGDFTSVILGFIALAILAALASTSFTFAMKAMGKWWKFVHRFVYLAALATLAHVALVGNHYENTASGVYLATLASVITLLVLHGIVFQRYLAARYPRTSAYVWTGVMALIGLLLGYGLELLHRFGHHHA